MKPRARQSVLSGHFIEGERGRLFVTLWEPLNVLGAPCVLVVPPFAEEMNKCRCMVAITARELAARGVATAVPDLYGTGDSDGDFEHAEWPGWRRDLGSTAKWCQGRGLQPTGLLAIRLGAALAAEAAARGDLSAVHRTVLWQPVFDGQRFLTQFLRLRVAATMSEMDRKESVQELRARLEARTIVEVAGYGLSGRLAIALDGLVPPARFPGELGATLWAEVVRGDDTALSPASAKQIESLRAAGSEIAVKSAAGEQFWTTTEIATVPAVVDVTASFLSTGAVSEMPGRSP